ncbi:Ni/Fe hydrogenase subunit alpha [Adlercreutzia sp. ZJ154]|uniref:Ni/Fe hydrogenase subunit alpha n=1 Tax=Adlercreutzia sp. ZJ154 TaxID=2709790 RepID=UPI0013EAC29A|nr:Ni/Fe hydrogenase subunit alpha [Adlercreutzia sp. ZJ154]
MTKTRIEVDHVARIEGHGDIHLEIADGKVERCEFAVTEPARMFEGMVRGRYFEEVPYISSRVCGICSASHTVTDILAIERIFGVEVTPRTRAIRQLLIYGSFLQNHATHLFVFAAPDFLGHKSVFPLADASPQIFEGALALKGLGNELCNKVGGRSIHPITAVVGGFTNELSPAEYIELADKMDSMLDFALQAVDLFNDFSVSSFETEGDMLAMVNPGEYPIVGSDKVQFVRAGISFDCQNINDYIEEYALDHSAAFLAVMRENKRPYFASALARVNSSWDALTEPARFAAAKAGLRPPEYNPFANNVAQAVEIVDALIRCSSICRALAKDEFEGTSTPVEFQVRAGRGVGFTEAPRGALFHELEIDNEGRIVSANIITPTSQNIANLEADMRLLATLLVEEGKAPDDIQLEIEKLVRAYDPCLSCSVH